ncbi:MAG: hypothetical protein J6U14_06845 [Bacteroidaceae bacterium]|nr:hypothetical protein [Bacteroidaceae bacterium]
MKKFFGLKMALAVLAAGAFVSCTDSEAGDIYIPTPGGGGSTTVDIKWPAASYVVNGVVTDADTSAAIEGVDVSGAISATTDANGYFTSGSKAAPINGVLTFAKDGYVTVNRTIVMAEASTGVVSEAMNVVMTSGIPVPDGELIPVGEPVPDAALAVEVPAAKLAGLVNNSDEEQVFFVDASDLPYGAVVAPTKAGSQDVIAYVKFFFGNDPFVGYGKYSGPFAVKIPARAKVVALKIIPLVFRALFTLDDFTQDLDVIEQYKTDATFAPIDQHDTHDGHNGQNVGGGSSDAA